MTVAFQLKTKWSRVPMVTWAGRGGEPKLKLNIKKMSTAKVFFLIQYFYKNQTLAILFTSAFQNIKNPLSVVIFRGKPS